MKLEKVQGFRPVRLVFEKDGLALQVLENMSQNSPVLRRMRSLTSTAPLGLNAGNASTAVPVIVAGAKLTNIAGAVTRVVGGVLS